MTDIRGSIAPEGESSLVFQDGGQLDADRAKIERIVKQTLAAVRALIPLDGIVVVVLADPSGAIPELGFGGRADAGVVRVWFNPGSAAMARSLDTDLFPLLAHEMHHVARFRTAGFATNLFDAMISEGLADHFAVEVAGTEPAMWATGAVRGCSSKLERTFARPVVQRRLQSQRLVFRRECVDPAMGRILNRLRADQEVSSSAPCTTSVEPLCGALVVVCPAGRLELEKTRPLRSIAIREIARGTSLANHRSAR